MAPRIHAELSDKGIHVGRKRVERLMQANGLRGVSRRKFVVTTERDPRARPAADLVDRNFYADAPNVLWVADITYVPTWPGFLYLAARPLFSDQWRTRSRYWMPSAAVSSDGPWAHARERSLCSMP